MHFPQRNTHQRMIFSLNICDNRQLLYYFFLFFDTILRPLTCTPANQVTTIHSPNTVMIHFKPRGATTYDKALISAIILSKPPENNKNSQSFGSTDAVLPAVLMMNDFSESWEQLVFWNLCLFYFISRPCVLLDFRSDCMTSSRHEKSESPQKLAAFHRQRDSLILNFPPLS